MSNNYYILPMDNSHINGVLSVSSLSFSTSWSRDSIQGELLNKNARYLVAIKDGIVIGYGGFWIIVDEAHITNIAVHPEFRSCGVASSLLGSLIDICKSENILSMTLEVRISNKKAQNLYNKFGFVPEGLRKNYYEDTKEDGIIMWKRDVV